MTSSTHCEVHPCSSFVHNKQASGHSSILLLLEKERCVSFFLKKNIKSKRSFNVQNAPIKESLKDGLFLKLYIVCSSSLQSMFLGVGYLIA